MCSTGHAEASIIERQLGKVCQHAAATRSDNLVDTSGLTIAASTCPTVNAVTRVGVSRPAGSVTPLIRIRSSQARRTIRVGDVGG